MGGCCQRQSEDEYSYGESSVSTRSSVRAPDTSRSAAQPLYSYRQVPQQVRQRATTRTVEPKRVYSHTPAQQQIIRPKVPPWKIQRLTLLPKILTTEETSDWNRSNVDIKDHRIIELDSGDWEFNRIKQLFKSSTKPWFQVVKIESVQNPFLMAMYCLRKEEMRCLRGGSIREELLFHGTKAEFVDKICDENFNWRRHGSSIGNRFGKGISFSKISYYASHYSSKNVMNKKMILAKVIIGNTCIGHGNMVIPDDRCDTSIKKGGRDVLVKYHDHEFYPAYIITYTSDEK